MKGHLFRTFGLCIAVLTLQCGIAQENDSLRTDKKDPRPFKDRMYYGGGLGLTFGSVTNIQVSPRIGYKVDQKGKWSVGIGGDYQYFQDNRGIQDYRTSIYGYSVFTRYRVLQNIFLHAEFQQLKFQRDVRDGVDFSGGWIPFLFLGGGYSASVGGNSYFVAQVVWDVIQDERSPYFRGGLRGQGPIASVGFVVGF